MGRGTADAPTLRSPGATAQETILAALAALAGCGLEPEELVEAYVEEELGGGDREDAAPDAATCADACANVYGCGFTFSYQDGSPVSERDCVAGCAGSFDAAQIDCLAVAPCTDGGLNGCF